VKKLHGGESAGVIDFAVFSLAQSVDEIDGMYFGKEF